MKLMVGQTLFLISMFLLSSCGKNTSDAGKIHTNGVITVSYSSSGHTKDETPVTDKNSQYTPGEKLLQTSWDQKYPFNQLIKLSDNTTPVAGCVPVALAQITNYHRPNNISQSSLYHSQVAPQGELRFGNYLWENIAEYQSRPVNKNIGNWEIARLIRDIGWAMNTQYRTTTSSTNMGQLPNYANAFGMAYQNKTIKAQAKVGVSGFYELEPSKEFINAIIESINDATPILFSLSGRQIPMGSEITRFKQIEFNPSKSTQFDHASIIDGYQWDQNGNFLVHINWGWGGRGDGFYPLKDGIKLLLNDKENTLIYFYELELYLGIKPCTQSGKCGSFNPTAFKTQYDANNGRVTSTSSVGHSNTEVAILNIQGPVQIHNRSGFYQLQFKNIENLQSFTFQILQSGPGALILKPEGKEFPTGKYLISINSVYSTRNLNSLPINFQILNRNKKPFINSPLPQKAPPTTRMDLDPNIPINWPMQSDYALPIRVLAPDANKSYQLRLTGSRSGEFQLVQDYLILSETANLSNPPRIGIELIETDQFGSQQVVQSAQYQFLQSPKKLQLATPSTRFEGSLKDGDHQFFLMAQGYCSIYGNRGLDSQAFFYSIESLDGQSIEVPQSDGISYIQTQFIGLDGRFNFVLPPGFYRLNASLTKGRTSYLINDNSEFYLQVDCDQNIPFSQDQILEFYGYRKAK